LTTLHDSFNITVTTELWAVADRNCYWWWCTSELLFSFYSVSSTEGENCDECVCLAVSVSTSQEEPPVQTSPNFLCVLPVG